jgi:hypothetical protein
MTNRNFFAKLPRVIAMQITGAILIATDGAGGY